MINTNRWRIEAKWQQIWEEERDYEIDLEAAVGSKQSKFYAFGMFSYPSGAGIHVGHVKNFTLPDVLLRWRRQKGDLVYAPVGFDAFGLPAENLPSRPARPRKLRPTRQSLITLAI